ncbi:hypothetical protein CK203_112491 [Vitis vinifera]|uniref:Uncharacterized protein n=1 Tax=Vitis vinifera TaxID=29760 RepID=A0A438EAV9_VITVI|nr:hypothetical protein CK203_112491 [Vitis vinifera]
MGRLFNLVGVIWVPPRSLEDMLVISFKGLGNSLRGKTLWQIACLTLIWMVWQERNNRIFEDKGRTEEMVWDLIQFYSSLWASCTEAFRGVPLSILQLNWIGVCVSRVPLEFKEVLDNTVVAAMSHSSQLVSSCGVKDQENAKGFSLEPFIMDLIPLYKPTRTVTLRRGVSKESGPPELISCYPSPAALESMMILVRELHVLHICKLALKLLACLFGMLGLVAIVAPNFVTPLFSLLESLLLPIKAFSSAAEMKA